MGQVFVFSLLAALNPVLIGASTVMLLLPNPKRLMLGYLCGALMTSITLGLVIVFALKGSSTVSTTENTISPAVDLALGAIMLLAAFVLGTGRDKRIADRRRERKGPKEDKGPPRWQRELSKGSARTTFVVGALLTLPGASYLAGLDQIEKQKLGTAATVLTVIGFNLVMLMLLELPLLGFVVAPDWTPGAVERSKAWFARNGHKAAVIALIVLGSALVLKGIIGLVADGGAVSTDGNAPGPPVSSGDGDQSAPQQDATLSNRLRQFAAAVRDGDEAMVEELVVRLSGSRRAFAPLALVVGGFVMLFTGLKLLFTNWRLTLVQILPAMWIWLALSDLKAHALHGKTFHVLRGPILIPIVLVITTITMASFFLNAVFGFAIVQSGTPKVRPAFADARSHLTIILGSGAVVGLMLAIATMIVTRAGRPWFGISLSVVVGVMMVSYVAVPARLIGVTSTSSRRDALTASAVGGVVGAVICTPPYVLGRIGILMLGSSALFIPGIIVISFATALQAGATGAVKSVKMSAKLLAPRPEPPGEAVVPDDPPPASDARG